MRAGYKLPASLGMTIGYLCSIASGVMLRYFPGQHTTLAWTLLVLSIPVIIWGCWRWAEGLGHHGAVGMFGLIFPLGLIILLMLPDKFPEHDPYFD